MKESQRLGSWALAAGGVVVLVLTGGILYRSFCAPQRHAENLALIASSRDESRWDIVETEDGHLIRQRGGRFAGWYLAHDPLVNPVERGTLAVRFLRGPAPRPGPHVRNLQLREERGPHCYWSISKSDRGSHVRAIGGPFNGWYLDLLPDYIPETGSQPPIAWNLALSEPETANSHWRLTPSESGYAVQATAGRFDGWFLDSLQKARILEFSPCWDEEVRKDGQAPPLADSRD